MPGHVFHPGHQDLHGITVVLKTKGSDLYVGRFDSQDERGVHLIDVSVFDSSSAAHSPEEFLSRTRKFGVRVDQPHCLVPIDSVQEIQPLGDPG